MGEFEEMMIHSVVHGSFGASYSYRLSMSQSFLLTLSNSNYGPS
jgi:hypothetical protein